MKSPKPKLLEPSEIETALSRLNGWSGDQHGLKKTVAFKDFQGAMRFMQACVKGIEKRDHHPVWCNRYNSVDIHLDTADAGHRVTEKDIDLAGFFESILSESGQDFGYKSS